MLAIDPGRSKCGVAVCTPRDDSYRPRILHREVVPTDKLVMHVMELVSMHHPDVVLMGDGTQSATLRKAVLKALPDGMPFEEVPEAFTSQRVRARLQKEWLPKGLVRLLPTGLRPAPKAYDDYVAALIAEDWLLAQKNDVDVVLE
ncbi:MAG: hypothetical protein ACKO14_12625 [Armatimonadota bacterium]